jgi:hypothetical protein
MKDPYRGPAFIRKQIGLQLTNPKIETGKGSLFGTTDVPGPIENTRVYNNGINTLEQVKYAGTGVHAVRHGLTPFSPFQNNYYSTVNTQNISGGKEGTAQNRLVILKLSKMTTNESQDFLRDSTVDINIPKLNQLGIPLNRNMLFQYLGGPGSVYGVGSTSIPRYEDTARLASQNPKLPSNLKENYIYLTRSNESQLLLLRTTKMVPNAEFPEKASEWGISENPFLLKEYSDQGPGTINRGNTGGVKGELSKKFSGIDYGKTEIPIAKERTSDRYLENVWLPEELRNNYQSYGSVNSDIDNRLLLLRDAKLIGSSSIAATSQWKISQLDTQIIQYENGPGTLNGLNEQNPNSEVGVDKTNTTIDRSSQNTRLLKSRGAMVYDQIAVQTINSSLYNTATDQPQTNTKRKIQDFRKDLPDVPVPMGTWEKKDTIESRFFIAGKNYVDKMNTLYPFIFDDSVNPWTLDAQEGRTDDTIKFVFEAVSNSNIGKSTAIFFRAYLNGGITDNNGGSWSAFKYMGRGEEFYTYQGFTRSISFAFKIFVGSVEEQKPMYNRINALVSQVYPDYSGLGVMRAPIIRLTIGDYLVRMPGVLDSVNVTSEGAWETESNDQVQQLPHVINVSVSFKPILTELPRRAGDYTVPRIIANNPNTIGRGKNESVFENLDRVPKV